MKWILKHQWLNFRRSPAFEKDLGIKIFLILLGLFLLMNLIFVSSNFNELLDGFGIDTEPTILINQFLLYYFISELGLRYLMQNVPALDIEPYLHLPISKNLVSKFLVFRSILSPYNLLAPSIFIGLTVSTVIPSIGLSKGLVWLLFTLSTSLILHFFNILIKKKLENSNLFWTVLLSLIAINYIGNNYLNFDLIPLGQWASAITNNPVLLIAPIIILLFVIYTSYKFFLENLYLEDLFDAKMMSGEKFTGKLRNWESKGLLNTLIGQELKLILRHKRSRSSVMMAGIFLFYPLLIFSMGKETQSEFMAIFVSIFFTGIFIIQYGQFLWSWNTNQMDFFLTQINPYKLWVESRYRLLVYSVIITSILSLPYFYYGYEIMLIMAATALYNVGINSMLIMRISLWGPKPIELDKSSMMNYQGVGAAQFVVGIPLILGPMIVYAPFSYIWNGQIGVLAIAVTGLIGIVLRKPFFNAIANKLKKDKYKLIHDLTI